MVIGVIVAAVEDVIQLPSLDDVDDNFQRCIAITHAGADLMLRTAYCPSTFPHRFVHLPSLELHGLTSEKEKCSVTIAGPLCFSGDVVASDLALSSVPLPGDFFLVLDAGANTISLFSRHCSRPAPVVYAFRRIFCDDNSSSELRIVCIKQQETEEDLMKFWG